MQVLTQFYGPLILLAGILSVIMLSISKRDSAFASRMAEYDKAMADYAVGVKLYNEEVTNMAIARNLDYTTIKVPLLDNESLSAVSAFIATLQAERAGMMLDATTLATITAGVMAAISEMSDPDGETIAAVTAATMAAMSMEIKESLANISLIGVDEPTAAMIIAILCEQLGEMPSNLAFTSIKAL